MRMRTLALASAVAVSALVLQPALAQTMTAPGQPGTSGVGTPPVSSPSTAQPPSGTSTGATSAATTPAGATRQLTVNALEDKGLVGPDGKKIADVEGMVENNADKKQFVIVERGGFLGIGAKEIAISIENIAVQGDKVMLRNMDVAQ